MMKSLWNKDNTYKRDLIKIILMALLFTGSLACGWLAFHGNTMNLRLAFYSLTGLLVVIALK